MRCGRHICLRAYANNVESMHICVPGHIVECTEFIWGLYTDIVVSCGLHVAFEEYISVSIYMAITCFLSHDADGAINDTIECWDDCLEVLYDL